MIPFTEAVGDPTKATFFVIVIDEFNGPDPSGRFSNQSGKCVAEVPDIDDPSSWTFDDNPLKAKLFASHSDARDFYFTPSKKWFDSDGEPFRPMTAFAVHIVGCVFA
jgi:hypothetical protein